MVVLGSATRSFLCHRSNIFILGETECTGERAYGQFSIFGAVEENDGYGSGWINKDQGASRRYPAEPRVRRGFEFRKSLWKRIRWSGEADCAQGAHRKCRKAVGSGQWSVASSGRRLLRGTAETAVATWVLLG